MPRKVLLLWLPFLALMLACQALAPLTLPQASLAGQREPAGDPPALAAPTPTPTPRTQTPPPVKTVPSTGGFSVRAHPDGPLYAGDWVSFEVLAPPGFDPGNGETQVQVKNEVGEILGTEKISGFGIGRRSQATLRWVWNTSGLQPGDHRLTFSVLPGGPAWAETFTLRPHNELPATQAQAHWAEARSQYAVVYYITGTAAERDLPSLLDLVDQQALFAASRLGAELQEPIPIVFLPRVLGHGGFAGKEISVSYLERNYASGSPQGSAVAMILHHEIVHLLDARLGGDLRPTFLAEGLATYLTGGHFKPEPFFPRAAALLPSSPGCNPCGLGSYIPLSELVDSFYFQQHETGYLEAAALIDYMVRRWGWENFNTFYRDIHPVEGKPQSVAVEQALRQHFGLGLDELEADFLQALRAEPLESRWVEDVRLTVELYDAVRSYQQQFDPSAHYLTAWLPDPEEMRTRGIVADYLRRPDRPVNGYIESLLVAAHADLQSGRYSRLKQRLQGIQEALNPRQAGSADFVPFYGQANSALKGGVQYRFRVSKTTALAAIRHTSTSRHPQPVYNQRRSGLSSSTGGAGG